ncbi:MAG: hypothetical protein QHG99_06085, partial [Methanomicrobiales archaeon]|nr:hypothetical protein [Methanomicrobiales archaeon]
FGLEENVASAATYLLGWLTGILFFVVEKENKTVRFHAVQSTILFIGLNVLYWIFSGMFVFPWGMWAFIYMINLLISIVIFVAWLFLMYKAYTGEKFKVPVVGEIAEKYA